MKIEFSLQTQAVIFEGFWKITKIYLNHSVKKSSFAQGTTVYNFL